MSKPTEKFSFNGNFSVGGAPSGENENAIAKGVSKINIKGDNDDGEEEGDEEDEDDEDMFANLPKDVVNRIRTIRKMHTEIEEIDGEYKLERIALEKKYITKKAGLNLTRTKIISGEIDPPMLETEAETVLESNLESSDIKGIPGFWLTVLTSHPNIGDLITEEDVPALENLADISCVYDDNFTTFVLTFTFNSNEYFTNTELTKKYVVNPDLLDDKAPALSEVDGCTIDWKEGKNLTVTEVKKKQKAKSGKNKGQVRTIVTTENKSSFFWYFSDPLTEEEEAEMQEKEEEEEESSKVKLSMEEDYEIGHSIRTSIIPEAVLWYTGEAIEEEEDEEGEDEDEDEDIEDEEDDEEDGDEDSPKHSKGNHQKANHHKGNKGKLTFTSEGGFKANSGGDANTNNGEKAPECKQN